MILRAIFWIGVVSLFMPHEPDLGFGRPGAAAQQTPTGPTSITGLIQTGGEVQTACTDHAAACAHGLSILDGFQALAVRGLDQVRAELDAGHKVRVAH